ncbi:MAG: hypothetical protein AB7I59_22955, partial [Geminicoccaceae bacterium]
RIREHPAVPIILFLILAALVAQFGFWDTLQGVLGAAAMLVGFVVLLVALLGLGGWYAMRRVRGGARPPSVR